ncbi:MAG: DUF542 domain-containing protein [Gemmatimonadota bacterium]|nr:DUF542 domain-containing protein [Gemmatimonadota bacterium]
MAQPAAGPVGALLTATMTLNEILLAEPRAVAVFARYGMDSCCGGVKPLTLVCEKHGLDLATVLAELRAL